VVTTRWCVGVVVGVGMVLAMCNIPTPTTTPTHHRVVTTQHPLYCTTTYTPHSAQLLTTHFHSHTTHTLSHTIFIPITSAHCQHCITQIRIMSHPCAHTALPPHKTLLHTGVTHIVTSISLHIDMTCNTLVHTHDCLLRNLRISNQ
jgi:hypothetical protein